MPDEKKNEVTLMPDATGTHYAIMTSDGKLHKGTVVIKPVNCGKKCGGCPHGFYKYIAWKTDGKTHWKYVGKTKEPEKCPTTQKNFGKPRP